MQSRIVTATLTLLAFVLQVSSVLLSETSAHEWLRNHPAPQGDELAELKTANPEAYAIVKALLTKRSLGLLDPKHPSASFAPAKTAPADTVPSGPEVFQALAGPSVSKSHEEYPDVPVAPAHHDWLNWKPKESAADDESMVNSVLGAVADLKAGKNLRGSNGETSRGGASVSSEAETSLVWTSNVVVTTSMPAKPRPGVQPAAPVAEQGNPYLKAIDFGVPVPTRAPASGDNSYLKSADLAASTTQRPKQDSTNYLATFSWDDTKVAPAKQEAPKPPVPVKKNNALLTWLGGSTGAGTVKAAVVTQPPAPVQPENPYLAALE